MIVVAACTAALAGCQQQSGRARTAAARVDLSDGPYASNGPAHPAAQPARGADASVDGIAAPVALNTVEARATPPVGWRMEPLKSSDKHTHQVWLSPSGDTAFGVIRFKLPFPVGADLALWGFLKEMKKTEGQADLVHREKDRDLPGMRFVAVGGKYKVRTNLITRGWTAWAVYAGTLREHDENPDELDRAERARERTRVGLKE